MIRTIISIDEARCDGCGLCVIACHEAAIAIVNGKAKLVRDDFCDGLGNCLPACPTGAITFVEREAKAFDEAAVAAHVQSMRAGAQAGTQAGAQAETQAGAQAETQAGAQAETQAGAQAETRAGTRTEALASGCPSANSRTLKSEQYAEEALPCGCPSAESKTLKPGQCTAEAPKQTALQKSQLTQWPIQIKLVPPNAPFLHQADLLIAADCAAYTYGNFHLDYMKDRITLIGCPKLDNVDYTEKLTAMLRMNSISSVTVVRIEVPCCSGIEAAVKTALRNSGKSIPLQAVTISVDGRVLPD